jgi:type II secretory pathway pseudopilin PulG
MILFFVAVLVISLAVVLPQVTTQLKRDREVELIHRANQYVRAIQLYYRKTGRYPGNIEQLDNTNNQRFLRKHYKDPVTGKDDWQMLQFGQVQPKQPNPLLAGSSGQAGLTPAAGLGSPAGGGISGGLGSPAGGQGQGLNAGASPTAPGTGGISGANGTSSNPFSSASSGPGARSFGGGAIVGVASVSEKESLKEINGKTHYNEWQFYYDPTFDPSQRPAAGLPGQGTPGLNPGTGTQPGANPGMGPGRLGPPQQPNPGTPR